MPKPKLPVQVVLPLADEFVELLRVLNPDWSNITRKRPQAFTRLYQALSKLDEQQGKTR